MKKTKIACLSTTFSLFMLTLSLLSQSAKQTDASSKSKLIVNDTFNSTYFAGKLDNDIWDSSFSNGNIFQSENGESYLCNKRAGGENAVFSTKNKIEDIKYYQFDFKYDSSISKWFSIVFMNKEVDGSSSLLGQYAYSGAFIANCDEVNNFGGTLSSKFNFKSVLGVNAIESWITCRVDVTSKNEAKLNFAVQGTEMDDANSRTLTYSSLDSDMSNAYVGLVTETSDGIINFDNFVVGYGKSSSIKEDFSNFDLDNPMDFTFFKDSPSRSLNISIKDNSTLKFSSKSNEFIYSLNQVKKDDSIIEEVEIVDASFNVKFPVDSNEETIAIVFGLNKDEPSISNTCLRYEMSKDKGVLKEFENGNQISNDLINTNVFSSSITSGSDINIKIYKSGKIIIKQDGNEVVDSSSSKVNFSNVTHYDGNVAIASITDISKDISFDNIKVINSFYYVPVTKSVTHNFENSFFGNKGYEDFVVLNGDGGGKLNVNNGKLVFDCGTDGTFFGSAHQYDSFILDFKLCSILADSSTADASKTATTLGRWIGLDLSRETKYAGSYGTYGTIITQIVPDTTYGDSINPALWSDADVSSLDKDSVQIINHKNIPVSMIKSIQYSSPSLEGNIKEGDAICFRFVSGNSSIKMYLKKASEANYTLYTEFKNLELNGYFALCCTGFTFMKIDDFSMVNTSSCYVCADNESPDTIYETVTKVIYDNNNPDTNLNEEIALNTQTNILAITFIATTSLLAIAVIVLSFLLVRGKKHGK